eukprot:g40781.t1
MVDAGLKGTQWFMKWPVLLVVGFILFVEGAIYLFARLMISAYENLSFCLRCSSSRSMMREMDSAQDYAHWEAAAQTLDRLEGRDQWKSTPSSGYYDYGQVAAVLDEINAIMYPVAGGAGKDGCSMADCANGLDKRKPRQQLDAAAATALLAALRKVFISRHMLGVHNPSLYQQTYLGTKRLITEFLQSVQVATKLLVKAPLPKSTKMAFFDVASHNLGRTCLCLSGGGALGYFHFGVLSALLESGCMPTVIHGTSAGSMVGSWLACRTDEEMRSLLNPSLHKYLTPSEEPWSVKLKRLWTDGVLFDTEKWIPKIKVATKGDTTFFEAFRHTGRVFCVTISQLGKHRAPILLNYINSPDVVIWSAVLCSSAMPRLLKPFKLLEKAHDGSLVAYDLHGKQLGDGSLQADVPINELSQQLNCSFFIVSQVNPAVMPFIFFNRGEPGKPNVRLRFTSGLRGGFFFAVLERFLKLDMRKWFRLLSEFDLLPNFRGMDMRFLFLQKMEGNATIIPNAGFTDYLRSTSDPTEANMASYLLRGAQATWPYLARVHAVTDTEYVLRDGSLQLGGTDFPSSANEHNRNVSSRALAKHSSSRQSSASSTDSNEPSTAPSSDSLWSLYASNSHSAQTTDHTLSDRERARRKLVRHLST